MRIEPGFPAQISESGEVSLWSRVDLAARWFSEDWLQQLVFDRPGLIPVVDIDPSFGPLLPIGREVPTVAGPIDALFISPDGALTIVEAKLWRNPQARREVVGQVIDYATALARWGFEDLESTADQIGAPPLWELVKDHSTFSAEQDFVDAVARNLRKGRFLLCIVGDGIREEVERMVDYVQVAPQLQFTLALVELRVYAAQNSSDRLIVPYVVARTDEVTRAVVEVAVAPQAEVHVDVTVPADDTERARRVLTADQYFDQLSESTSAELVEFAREVKSDFEEDNRFLVDMKVASFVVKLRDPKGGSPMTILVFNRVGNVHPGWLGQQLPRAGLPAQLGYELVADVARITGGTINREDPQWLASAVPLADIRDSYPELRDRIDRFASSVYQRLGED